MNETMIERIRSIMDYAKLSQQDFAARLGISPASLSSILTGRTNPTNKHVMGVHVAFPEINVNWLMFGEGEMLVMVPRVIPHLAMRMGHWAQRAKLFSSSLLPLMSKGYQVLMHPLRWLLMWLTCIIVPQ